MSKIRIANPQPGSARYTTASQAERYVRRKEAVIIDSELHFLSPSEQRRMQTINRIFQSDWEPQPYTRTCEIKTGV
jgi:hypothetical protein